METHRIVTIHGDQFIGKGLYFRDETAEIDGYHVTPEKWSTPRRVFILPVKIIRFAEPGEFLHGRTPELPRPLSLQLPSIPAFPV